MAVSVEDHQFVMTLKNIMDNVTIVVLFVFFPAVFFLNILTITVFLRKKFREHYTNLYTIVIVLVNNTIILVNYPLFYQDAKNELLIVRSDFLCIFLYYIARLFSSFHSWLLVMSSLERTLHVIFPYGFKFMKKRKNIFAIMFALFIANVAVYYPTTFFRVIENASFINQTNQTVIIKTCGSAPLHALNDSIRIISRIVVPFILILILSSLLIYKLLKKKRKVKAKSNLIRGYNFSKIIALTCLLFLLSFAPLLIVLLFYSFGIDVNSSVRILAVSELVKAIAQTLTLINYSSTFLINLKFSSMFREEILIIFKGIKKIFQKQN